MVETYDAVLVLSFGGPEGPDEVMPFLRNVLRGKNVPDARLHEVAEHYEHFGGASPINAQNRSLIAALENLLAQEGPSLPVYWGNRNWYPLLTDTLRQMASDGVRKCLAFVTSAYSSYSGCRQYLEDIQQAQQQVGVGAPQVDKLRAFFNHPGFINPMIQRVTDALAKISVEQRADASLVFTAHSIPLAMASGCQYEAQVREACRLVCRALGDPPWQLAFQSRSGPPGQPWLEPDILDVLRQLGEGGQAQDVVVVPIGFISDHMEVRYDLDIEARQLSEQRSLNMIRAETVGTAPQFVDMIRQLILERTEDAAPAALGTLGPAHNVCPADCCPSGRSSAPRPACPG